MLIKPALVPVIGGPAAASEALLARRFINHNDLVSGFGGAALEEDQVLIYLSGSSQERIERGSQPPCATSKSAANVPMRYATQYESAR
jgi:hypothetical protein